jgi:hypothetical protein
MEEVAGGANNPAGALVGIDHVEAVPASRMFHHFNQRILCQRLADKLVDARD